MRAGRPDVFRGSEVVCDLSGDHEHFPLGRVEMHTDSLLGLRQEIGPAR